MIDQISIRIDATPEQVRQLVQRHRLTSVGNEGSQWAYVSGEQRKLTGIVLKIDNTDAVYIECSLHKQYNRIRYGQLNNYGIFTMQQARQTLTELLPDVLGMDIRRAVVRKAEIGLTMTMPHDAGEYIMRIVSVGDKELIEEPRYRENFQKVTRQINTRRIYKIYDKTGESRQKRRRDIPHSPMLRIETKINFVKDRGAWTMGQFLGQLPTLAIRFLKDWQSVIFIAFCTEQRPHDEDRYATLLMALGVKRFNDITRIEHSDGRITADEKQRRDSFAARWNDLRRKEYARGILSIHEREYFDALKRNYNEAIADDAAKIVSGKTADDINAHKRTLCVQKRRAAFFGRRNSVTTETVDNEDITTSEEVQ